MRRAAFHRLEEGCYRLVPLEENRIFRSQAIPGFWLDVDWLFADQRPPELDCALLVLGRDPLPSPRR